MATKSATKPSARERLLAAANELFYDEGVHTVGIDRVIEHAGVAKASLYNTFGSKDALVRAYLETRHDNMVQRIMGRRGPVRRTARAAAGGVRGPGRDSRRARLPRLRVRPGQRGMPSRRLVEQATSTYRGWVRGLFTELAGQAGVPEPQVLARQLHLLYDGASQSARLDHDPAAALAARAAAAVLLGAVLAAA